MITADPARLDCSRSGYRVVDNFYADPDAIRRSALRQDYERLDFSYPGVTSREQIALDAALDRFAALCVATPRPTPHCGKVRLSVEGESWRFGAGVHYDRYDINAVVYLTAPEHCQGGTLFFRHAQTGVRRYFECPPGWKGYDSASDFSKAISEAAVATSIDNVWELVGAVPMRFNRAVLIEPFVFHAAGSSFGNCISTGRLTQAFFLDLH
ncbi:MAG: DUF6445 family protein [Myxococcota bacterium]